MGAKRRVRTFAVLVTAVFMLAGGINGGAASAAPAGCGTVTGDGSQADPWLIQSSIDLACFATGTWTPAGGTGATAFVQLMANVAYQSAQPLFAGAGTDFARLDFDGAGRTITIRNVTGFTGLFADQDDVSVTHLRLHTENSTLASTAGWFMDRDTRGTYTDVSSDGAISLDSGGIVGASSQFTTLQNARSSGEIGNFGGGLIGAGSGYANVSRSYSTGAIGWYAGGLVGAASQYATVTQSFSLGAMDPEAGGILSRFAHYATVSSVFSMGQIDGFTAGGILGSGPSDSTVANAYTTGALSGADSGGIIGEPVSNNTILNAYSSGALLSGYRVFGGSDQQPSPPTLPTIVNTYNGSQSGWADSTASLYLTGVPVGPQSSGTTWVSCGVNLPYALAAFYPSDICTPLLPALLTASVAGASTTSITAPAGLQFSLQNTFHDGPNSFVALVNDTGSVRIGTTDCVDFACPVQDLVPGQGDSARTFTIVGSGTIKLIRYADGSSAPVEVATINVSRGVQAPLVVTSTSVDENQPLLLSATGGSGTGALTWSVVAGICTIQGSTLQPMPAGSPCVVRAEKAGDATYDPTTSADTAITVLATTPAGPISPSDPGTLPATGRTLSGVLTTAMLLVASGSVLALTARRARLRR